ncbi:MAG: DsbA family protein [Chloroflexaceae bacterium]|nr:DsbA family protein [Chloroflexaceae bacterium]NJO06726.1 DsbA family protein [Chloroflexaceae bacterium]
MSTTSPRRGRKVQQTKKNASSMRVFYFVIGIVALAGIAAAVTFLTSRDPATAGVDGIEGIQPFEVPYETGITEDGFHFKGAADAPVTIVEYADYQCPACANFATSSLAETINAQYIANGQVRLILHDFPLPMHPNAPTASQAAYCAGDQNQYWQMHDWIYRTQDRWSGLSQQGASSHFARIAASLGIDTDTFSACLADGNGQYRQHVGQAYQAAQTAGVPATPTFVVNGQMVPTAQLAAALDAALTNSQ